MSEDINVGAISEALNNKMDRDNLNASDTGTAVGGGWSFPSNSYVDLTVESSGTVYTMPSCGWLCIGFQHPNTSDWINFGVDILDENNNFIWNVSGTRSLSNQTEFVVVPIGNNQKVRIYQNAFNITRFRFIYAVGSEP